MAPVDTNSAGLTGSHGPDAGAYSLRNDSAAIDRLASFILAAMEQHGFAKASLFAVRLAFVEAVANAFNHGHRGLSPDLDVAVAYKVDGARVVITIEDRGPGFDPSKIPDPTLDENLENTSGRGLMLMKAYMTSVRYNGKGNKVEMVYAKPVV
jgi:serine/threonine-protein kinase RsbW